MGITNEHFIYFLEINKNTNYYSIAGFINIQVSLQRELERCSAGGGQVNKKLYKTLRNEENYFNYFRQHHICLAYAQRLYGADISEWQWT